MGFSLIFPETSTKNDFKLENVLTFLSRIYYETLCPVCTTQVKS